MRAYYEDDYATIYHGDCREIMPSLSADVIVTDPPYGISYQHGSRKGGVKLGTDGLSVIGDTEPFDPAPFLGFHTVVLWGANHYASQLPNRPGWLVWDKRCGIDSNDQSDCEMAWTSHLTTARLFSRYWNGGSTGEVRIHPTQKPIKVMAWCLSLVPPGTVLDPFMGSGTTIRAAKDLQRKSIGIEIEERYAEIAARRLAQEVFDLR